ncbi:MAG: acetoacetate--CoA ligase [Cytophagaceae bacterium]|nr:acetoacetate--CoA ligase [Cytophagaceae bacterium]
MNSPRILWQPSPDFIQNSNLTRYASWLKQRHGLDFQDYQELHCWSVENLETFWESLVAYFDINLYSPYNSVLSGGPMPTYRWFEGATLNYAEHVFRQKNAEHPALFFASETQPLTELSWNELYRQTAALAAWLRQAGVRPGDRVVGYLPTIPQATVALLASLSVGAVWSSCSPDFGTASVLDRFRQVEPKVLLAVTGYQYGGKWFDKTADVAQLVAELPTVENVIYLPSDRAAPAQSEERGKSVGTDWQSVLQTPATELIFSPVPFAHPIWILYSSGTTGLPKAITHSHGGVLLEHLKYLTFHNDVKPGERFFWYTTTGWMMWNFLNASLLVGATAVLYDGSPGYPDLNVLWKLAQDARIQHFGTSAPFLMTCLKNKLEPHKSFDLSALRSVGSTGSPLPPEGFTYAAERVKPGVWLSSMSGGTDICTAWVGGCPWEPVVEGEIQCRCLGCAMEAFDEAGQPVTEQVGEMVVTKPMPSMPVFFWNDADFARYRASYFEEYAGLWRHGDFVRITARGSIVIYGRSDATLNRQGVRIGTAEIYRAVEQIPEVKDSLIVHLERPDGSDFMPLFVVLNENVALDDALIARLKAEIRRQYSPRHVPDAVLATPEIPYTLSGKKMELPVKKILLGQAPEKVVNAGSVRNPEAIGWFVEWARESR